MGESAHSFGPRESQWPQKCAKEVLLECGFGAVAVAPTASVLTALELMEKEAVQVLVVKRSGWLVGIFTERDYAAKVVLTDQSSADRRKAYLGRLSGAFCTIIGHLRRPSSRRQLWHWSLCSRPPS